MRSKTVCLGPVIVHQNRPGERAQPIKALDVHPWLRLYLLTVCYHSGRVSSRGVAMTWSKRSYASSPSKRTLKGCVCESFHPGNRFQKALFSGNAFTVFVWTIGQNDAKHLHWNQKASPCGRPLNDPTHCCKIYKRSPSSLDIFNSKSSFEYKHTTVQIHYMQTSS